MSSSRTMSLAIVGAGRVGRALGKLLRDRGWRIAAVVTCSSATARAAVRAIGAGKPFAHLTPEILSADVILLTTPDSAIAATAAKLAQVTRGIPPRPGVVGATRLALSPAEGRVARSEWGGRIVLHTSGALDSCVLAPLTRLGAAVGSLHPLQTFGARSIPSLRGVLFTLEGDPRAARVARRIARQLGGIPIEIPARAKPAYHAAGAFAAAHMLSLIEGGTQMLVKLGFPKKQAQRGLLRMARQMLSNLETLGPRASWSGPVSRGDFSTVEKHMVALAPFATEFSRAHAAMLLLSARVLAADNGATLRRLKRMLKD
ncbi:MAG: DUF2520 domain-containing protein [Acidobacteria bacterium]|nr:DUF2520 domain-containing protein [Acidobacteriota bacterium]MBI3662906.1 DUF2520 domain-containing protein [Acidobacteriota bacterium]